jgi:hypothetical protein
LWHLDGEKRERRNEILRARDPRDYGFVDWLYGVTALTPAEEPPMFQVIPLDITNNNKKPIIPNGSVCYPQPPRWPSCRSRDRHALSRGANGAITKSLT